VYVGRIGGRHPLMIDKVRAILSAVFQLRFVPTAPKALRPKPDANRDSEIGVSPNQT